MVEAVGNTAPTPTPHPMIWGGEGREGTIMTSNFLSPDALLVYVNTKLRFSGDFAIENIIRLISLSKRKKSLRHTFCTLAGVGRYHLPNLCNERWLSGINGMNRWFQFTNSCPDCPFFINYLQDWAPQYWTIWNSNFGEENGEIYELII